MNSLAVPDQSSNEVGVVIGGREINIGDALGVSRSSPDGLWFSLVAMTSRKHIALPWSLGVPLSDSEDDDEDSESSVAERLKISSNLLLTLEVFLSSVRGS